MFREMRRKKQALPEAEAVEILSSATSGVLAVSGDDGYPYAVPLSHIYQDGKLYFHCALAGHKLDAIRTNPKVSYCVVAQDEVVPEAFATHYRSAIAFGTVRILTLDQERLAALEALVARFSPDHIEAGRREIEKDWEAVCVLELSIAHLTGKQAKGLN